MGKARYAAFRKAGIFPQCMCWLRFQGNSALLTRLIPGSVSVKKNGLRDL